MEDALLERFRRKRKCVLLLLRLDSVSLILLTLDLGQLSQEVRPARASHNKLKVLLIDVLLDADELALPLSEFRLAIRDGLILVLDRDAEPFD